MESLFGEAIEQQILVAVNLLCESDERRKTYQVIIAIAAKNARIVWALLAKNSSFSVVA